MISEAKRFVLFIGTRLEAFKATQILIEGKSEYSLYVATFLNTKLHEYLVNTNYNSHKVFSKSKNQALNELQTIICELNPEFVISVGFPYIIPPNILDYKEIRFYNLHPHILPKWKGYNAIKDSLAQNENYFGATFHNMTVEVDDGEIIFQQGFILDNRNLPHIYDALFSIIEPFVIINGLKRVLNE